MFNAARTNLTQSRRDALDNLLSTWDSASGVASQAAANLREERGSTQSKLDIYLGDLADNATDLSAAALPNGPRELFERTGKIFAFAGHEATPFKSALFGRAILLEKYIRYLTVRLDELGCWDTAEEIRDALGLLDRTDEGRAPMRLRIYFEAMRTMPLGRGAIFATFVKSRGSSAHPWVPIPDASAVRNGIALGEDPLDKDYILFAYNLPNRKSARVPTTASPGWFYQRWFRPNPNAAADLHGWTAPLSPVLEKRPEIVHDEIDGGTLVFPIHIAKA